jgi:cyclopropane fatty-acyl-phospholipid synthase-like methyltransferase
MIKSDLYKKNLDFWEVAWSRVKKASNKIPDVLDYIPDIPKVFDDYDAKNILDIACGSGWLSFYLADNGFSVTGVDISESAIRLAKKVIDEAPSQYQDKVKFVCLDMFQMDFQENCFDGILINAAFEHLDFERGKQFLTMIKKFIKQDGIMFGVFDKVASGKKGEFEVLEDGTHQYKDEFRDGMFLRNYSDEELDKLLKDTGWQVQSLRKNSFESRIIVAKNIKN